MAFYKVYKINIRAHKANLKRYSVTLKHKTNVLSYKGQDKFQNYGHNFYYIVLIKQN